MKKLNYLLLLLCISCGEKEVTNPVDFLKENAIPIKDISKLNQQVYKEISDYDIIMVGEMHGTKEPAEFVYGLCNTDKVTASGKIEKDDNNR